MRNRRNYSGTLDRPLLYKNHLWEYIPPTADEVEAFKIFLARLVEVERTIKREFDAQIPALKRRVERGEIFDYESQVEITFFLREDDPACIEDEDNILFTLESCGGEGNFLCSDLNWDCELYNSYPLRGHYHPYLFHELKIHSRIGHRDLLRIGLIWADVDITVQQLFEPPAAPPQEASATSQPVQSL